MIVKPTVSSQTRLLPKPCRPFCRRRVPSLSAHAFNLFQVSESFLRHYRTSASDVTNILVQECSPCLRCLSRAVSRFLLFFGEEGEGGQALARYMHPMVLVPNAAEGCVLSAVLARASASRLLHFVVVLHMESGQQRVPLVADAQSASAVHMRATSSCSELSGSVCASEKSGSSKVLVCILEAPEPKPEMPGLCLALARLLRLSFKLPGCGEESNLQILLRLLTGDRG